VPSETLGEPSFRDPIPLRAGGELRTLRDAAETGRLAAIHLPTTE
jgi:hypothetical protein